MEEKILIKSEHYDWKTICRRIYMVIVIIGVIASLVPVIERMGWSRDDFFTCLISMFTSGILVELIIWGVVLLLIGFVALIKAMMCKCEMIITDKGIQGSASFGQRVDLPLDSISAIKMDTFKGIAVSTASGLIRFYLFKNRDEIYSVVSKLIKYSLQGTTQGRYLTGGVPPVRFSM